MEIYIGNLSAMTTATQLASLFMPFGIVKLSRIARDKAGKSLGFGFVEMESKGAQTAIHKLNSHLFMNNYMQVEGIQDK